METRESVSVEPTIAICRICHGESAIAELISPCRCKGTQVRSLTLSLLENLRCARSGLNCHATFVFQAYVHAECERLWQIECGSNVCRVCKQEVAVSHSLPTVR